MKHALRLGAIVIPVAAPGTFREQQDALDLAGYLDQKEDAEVGFIDDVGLFYTPAQAAEKDKS